MKRKKWIGISLLAILLGFLPINVQAVSGQGTEKEPVPQAVTEAVTEEVTEPITEPITEPVTEPVTNPPQKPFVSIDNRHVYKGMEKSYEDGYTPVVKKKKALLTVPFLVKGDLKEEELYVDVDLGEPEKAPFVFQNYNRTLEKKSFSFNQEKVEAYVLNLDIALKETYQSGAYPVTVQIDAHGPEGEIVSQEYTFYITVEGEEEPVSESDTPAKEENPEAGDLGYTGGQGDEGSQSEASEAQTEAPLTQPKVLLQETNLTGQTLKAGESFQAKVKFQNTNKDTYIQNIKVLISAVEDTIQFDKRSFYIEKVSAKGEFEISFTLQVLKDTQVTKQKLNFAISYENKKAEAVTDTEELLLQITQPVHIEMENLDLPKEVFAAETIPVKMKVLNLSRCKVYNVRYTMEGQGIFAKESAFIGNIEAGVSAEGKASVFIGTKDMAEDGTTSDKGGDDQKYGNTKGILTLTYEDEFGTSYTETMEFTTQISKPEILTPKIPDTKQETESEWWISVLAAGGGILLVLAILGVKRLVVRKAESYEK